MQMNKKLIAAAVGVALAAAGIAAVVMTKFTPSEQPVGYVAQPTPSTIDVSGGAGIMYSIDYDAKTWTGNLHAYPITAAGAVTTDDDWDGGAAAKIGAQTERRIVTFSNGDGVEFTWASLAPADQTALGTEPVLQYLRGVKTNEGSADGQYRVRSSALGDIIHSTPVVYSGSNHTTIFVGANDGMLHAINGDDGTERYAYIPGVLMPRLKNLASRTYTHDYYVDGRMDVRKFGTQAVLVGTLGGGGKAVFGLDVTAVPTSQADAATKVLWEITNASANYTDLGDTYGAPTLFNLKPAAVAAGQTPVQRPALAVGNGYNSASGKAVLYLINPLTGARLKALETTIGSTTVPNGLSSPSLWDSDGDGFKDVAYAGDLQGNLWRFDLVTDAVTKLMAKQGDSQSITMAPAVSKHPLGGALVHFVTGRMLLEADADDKEFHYAYGIWDGKPTSNTTLLEQTLTEDTFEMGAVEILVRTSGDAVPNWTPGNHAGWKTKLPLAGERVVGDGAYVTGGVFQFLSTNPTASPAAKPPGDNWWMQLNALTGGSTGTTQFDLSGDSKFTTADQVGGLNPVGRNMGGGVRSQLIGLSAGGIDIFHSNFDKNGAPSTASEETKSENFDGERGVSGGHFDTDIFCAARCGGSDAAIDPHDVPAGLYYVGKQRSSIGPTSNFRFVHVHEYDDIYDKIGLSMLRPSQDLQRLRLVKDNTLISSNASANEAAYKKIFDANGVSANPAATLVGTPTTRGTYSGKNYPDPLTTYSYARSEAEVSRTAVHSTTGSTVTSVTRMTNIRTMEEVVKGGSTSGGKVKWDIKTTKHKWTVDTTTVTKSYLFKVLVANQAHSPAVTLHLKDSALAPASPNFEDRAYKFQTKAGLKVAELSNYDIDKIMELKVSMPLDAFNVKDWGTGVTRTGLHPIFYQCVGVYSNARPVDGIAGEWRNGALTVQIVQSGISDSDIQMNVSGRPELGYRLTDAAYPMKIIAEYLIYWHHPNGKCMRTSDGWSMAPPIQTITSTAKAGIGAIGEDDPHGEFLPTVPGGTQIPPNPTPTSTTNDKGDTVTTTITYTPIAGGGYTKKTVITTTPVGGDTATGSVVTGGAVNGGEVNTGGISRNAAKLGRINWRELQK